MLGRNERSGIPSLLAPNIMLRLCLKIIGMSFMSGTNSTCQKTIQMLKILISSNKIPRITEKHWHLLWLLCWQWRKNLLRVNYHVFHHRHDISARYDTVLYSAFSIFDRVQYKNSNWMLKSPDWQDFLCLNPRYSLVNANGNSVNHNVRSKFTMTATFLENIKAFFQSWGQFTEMKFEFWVHKPVYNSTRSTLASHLLFNVLLYRFEIFSWLIFPRSAILSMCAFHISTSSFKYPQRSSSSLIAVDIFREMS